MDKLSERKTASLIFPVCLMPDLWRYCLRFLCRAGLQESKPTSVHTRESQNSRSPTSSVSALSSQDSEEEVAADRIPFSTGDDEPRTTADNKQPALQIDSSAGCSSQAATSVTESTAFQYSENTDAVANTCELTAQTDKSIVEESAVPNYISELDSQANGIPGTVIANSINKNQSEVELPSMQPEDNHLSEFSNEWDPQRSENLITEATGNDFLIFSCIHIYKQHVTQVQMCMHRSKHIL